MGMKKFIIILLQCTWGILQTFLGLILFLLNIKKKHYWHRNAIVTEWYHEGSISLGLFLFVEVSRRTLGKSVKDIGGEKTDRLLVMHEYGHSIQSLILGPLYLLVIGIPSFIWANLPYFNRKRGRKHISYYSFWPERWANELSSRVHEERILL